MALVGIFDFAEKNPITTNHNGKIAPIIDPSPAEMYLTPQLLSPFAIKKFRKLSMKIDRHSFPFGHLSPFVKKKRT